MSAKKQVRKPIPQASGPSKGPAKKEVTPVKIPLLDFFKGKEALALILLILIISFFIFKDFIFMKKIYLFNDIGSDSINIFYPMWAHIADLYRTDGIPSWTFNVGMGQNLYGYEQGNPFCLFLFLLGSKNLPYGIVYMEILKILFSGIFIYYYLRTLRVSGFGSLCGGLIYAFSGYMILGSTGWYTHSAEAFYASFFLFAAERFVSRNQWYYVALAAMLIGCIHAYFLFPFGILLAIYYLVRHIDVHGWSVKSFIGKFSGLCASFFLGAIMSGVFLINMMLIIYNSPRVSGSSTAYEKFLSKSIFGLADAIEYVSFAMRLFSNDLIGNGNAFKGWMNYLESPILYISIPCLLLFSQFYTQVKGQRRKLYLITLGFLFMIIIFPFFRYAFWGFGLDYFRTFSFFISIYLFYIAMRALQGISDGAKVNLLILGVSLAFYLFLLYGNYSVKNQLIEKGLRSGITFLLILYAFLIYLWQFPATRTYVKIVFIFSLCCELIYFSRTTVLQRDAVKTENWQAKTGYNDYTVDAMADINAKDSSFFRVTKYYASGSAMHSSMNDAMVQKFRGTISYSSFNQKYYIQFLQGVRSIRSGDPNDAKWANGVSSRPLLQSLVGIKYVLTKTNMPPLDSFSHRKKGVFGDVQVYENKTYIPLGITYDQYILPSDFAKLSDMAKDVSLLKAFVVDSAHANRFAQFKPMVLSDTAAPFTWDAYYKSVHDLSANSLNVTRFKNDHIQGKISVDKQKLLFLSIPYDEGWKLKVNGKEHPIEVVDFGLMGVLLEKGENAIDLSYHPPFSQLGYLLSVLGILIFAGLFIWYKKRDKKTV